MRKLVLSAAWLVTMAAVTEARAWGLHTGDTIGTGDNLAYGEVGWPGVSAGFAHGFNDRLEIGGRLDVLYGIEGTPHSFFGLGFGATFRYTLLRSTNFSAEVHALPGFKFDAVDPVLFGLSFPIGGEVGYHVTRQATVSLGLDLPMFADFTNGGYFCIAPQGGPGFEQHVDEHLTLGLVTRFGGAAIAGTGGPNFSDFAFRLQAFVGYRM